MTQNAATTVEPLDLAELKLAFLSELDARRCGGSTVRYANMRGQGAALYGLTGAINVRAALGAPLGDGALRAKMREHLMSWRDASGMFTTGEGPGHALKMVIGALNLLGEPLPPDPQPLAPTDPDKLDAWLSALDWRSTHKELAGRTIPLLAGGRVTQAWRTALARGLADRLHPDQPAETWCRTDDPPWRVISCMYHVLAIFDAGRLPYPQPERLLHRLLPLHWHDASDDEQRTICTDADWAWMLLRLAEHRPRFAELIMQQVRRVSARRVRAWRADPEATLRLSTHHLYCHLWSTAVFQSCVRDHYVAGYVRDTLNDPSVFRLSCQTRAEKP